jgi:hypothetical protein
LSVFLDQFTIVRVEIMLDNRTAWQSMPNMADSEELT